jgi:hypothetical protein
MMPLQAYTQSLMPLQGEECSREEAYSVVVGVCNKECSYLIRAEHVCLRPIS